MRKMLECFLFVMNQVIDNPAIRFSDIATVTEEEKEQILYKFNQGDTEYPKEDTIVTLFEKQVIKMKEQIAVVYGDQKITYQELNQHANAVAKKLREWGTGPDDFIAILAERSIEMIIGIFGILKAGGAYVPIDPSYPSERISYTLNDCKPKAVLVYHMDNAEKVCGKLPILDLETFKYSKEIVENLPCINEPHNAAYVIYTSGTTGRPKGVVVEHVNVVRLLYNDGFQYDFVCICNESRFTLWYRHSRRIMRGRRRGSQRVFKPSGITERKVYTKPIW